MFGITRNPRFRLLIRIGIVLAAGRGPAPAQTLAFPFNGDLQGWTMKGAYIQDAGGHSLSDTEVHSNFVLEWRDDADYPNKPDGLGNGKGSLGMRTPGGHGISFPGGTWWIMEFHSPDLSADHNWQTAGSYSAYFYNTVGSLWANLYVNVYDHDRRKVRHFYNGTAVSLPLNGWKKLTFTDWQAESVFPRNFTLQTIHVDVWGLLANSYTGVLYMDAVTSDPLACNRHPGAETIAFNSPVTWAAKPCLPDNLYQISGIPIGGPFSIGLTDPAVGDRTSIFFRWGFPPTPALFDFAVQAPDVASPTLVVPAGRNDLAYVLLDSSVLPESGSSIEIRASAVNFALTSFSVAQAKAGGPVSGSALGAGFGATTAFSLVPRAGGAALATAAKTLIHSGRADVTFDLSKAAAGAYDLKAAGPGALQATLPSALQVLAAGRKPGIEIQLVPPPRVRVGRVDRLTLRYRNLGDEEMDAPLFRVAGSIAGKPDPVVFRLERETDFVDRAIQVLGVDRTGPAGKLRPGGSGEIGILFRCSTDGVVGFRADVFQPAPGLAATWGALAAPSGLTGAQWATLASSLPPVLGATWEEYGAALAARATRLARRGVDAASAAALFRFASREALGRPTSAVTGDVRDAVTGKPAAGAKVLALLGSTVKSSAVADSWGFYAIDWLRPGTTYTIRVVDMNVGTVSAAVPAAGDVLGLDIAGQSAANGLVPACPDCNAAGLPPAPPALPDAVYEHAFDAATSAVSAWDPNEKDGPGDDGDPVGREEIAYTVYFENKKEASAAAQKVVVDDILSPFLDATELRVTDVRVGGTALLSLDRREGDHGDIIPSSGAAGGALYLGPLGDWLLDVRGEYDPALRRIRWTFQTLDPATGVPPASSDFGGFLPPNKVSPEGEAFVQYTVMPAANTPDDTEITNEATVTFDDDSQHALTTDRWSNVFKTSIPPEPPHNPRPPDGADPAIRVDFLTWQSLAEEYSVTLWEDGTAAPQPQRVFTRSCPPGLTLAPGKLYRWKVAAKTTGVVVDGPVWSFRAPDRPFRRGDATADGSIDMTDAIGILSFLFLGTAEPPCKNSADVDGNGSVELTDAIYLLNHLFLGGQPPPPPFTECGGDAVTGLRCLSFDPCGR